MSPSREVWPTTVRLWRESRVALTSALSTYVDLCSHLAHIPLDAALSTKELASEINSTLGPTSGSLHSILSDELAHAQVMLARTRNRLVPPIYSCPEEILSKIFSCYVHDPNFDDTQSTHPSIPHDIGTSIRTYYYRLHNLLGVSFLWREIGLSMPTLWTLIPVIKTDRAFWSKSATELSLSRSGSLPLDLAIKNPQILTYNQLVKTLIEHTPRFRTVNIVSEQPRTVRDIMEPLLDNNVANSLSDLSLCTSDLRHVRRFGSGSEPCYMFLPESPQNNLFLALLKSLTRFRLYGSSLNWGQVSFSSRLVELQLNSVILGSDSHLHSFLRTLSTAPQLQKFALISVVSFSQTDLWDPPEVVLPNLRLLILEDLYFNTLSIILRSVTSRSHQTELNLTDRRTMQAHQAGDHASDHVSVYALCDLLQAHAASVTTLLLSDELGVSFKTYETTYVLSALPSLKTLKLHHWEIGEKLCMALMRRDGSGAGTTVPRIQSLYLTRASIANQESLKDLVLNHSIQTVVVGGKLNHGSEESKQWQFLSRSDDIVGWLSAHVPFFSFVDRAYDPPEFQSSVWQLW